LAWATRGRTDHFEGGAESHNAERWRFVINVFTSIRICTPEGRLELKGTQGAATAPPG
jgi:hypothetical protein